MAKVNTEKPAGKDQGKKLASAPKPKKEKIMNAPVKEEEKVEGKVEAEKLTPEKEKTEEKKPQVKRVKKSETSVNVQSLGVSTKVAASICKFIKHKKIETALKELEEVSRMKKAVPMKGEYAHRRGKIMSGKYPVNAAKEFIVLLKSLEGNANNHDISSPVITEAIANKGPTIYTSGGRNRKRTHVRIVASEKKSKKTKEEKN